VLTVSITTGLATTPARSLGTSPTSTVSMTPTVSMIPMALPLTLVEAAGALVTRLSTHKVDGLAGEQPPATSTYMHGRQ
jgi:hypothetical protein